MTRKKIKELSDFIFKGDDRLSLENRLFLSTIMIGILATLIGSVVSITLSSSITTLIAIFSLFLILVIFYYFVRIKGVFKPFIIPVISFSFIGISIIWVFDGGINGSDLMVAFVILILALIIAPDKARKFVIFSFIALVIIIYLIQLYRPDLITGFSSEEARWTDSVITAVYSSFLIFLIIKFLLKNYELEKKRAEENEMKLRQSNADKDLFISILAHDLRNPFNTLLGISELLLEDIHTQDMAATEKQIDVLHTISKRTFDMLEDLLLWARSQSGKLDFKPVEINFVKTCIETVENMQIVALSKEIIVNYSGTGNILIAADEDMLKVVLRNLISNAIKFTNPGGVINIRTEQISSTLTVIVSDNGVGISPETIMVLFDISKKTTSAGTSNEKGTGLGLLLCKEFVERHGGKIWVESVPGKGSDFKFTLPLSIP